MAREIDILLEAARHQRAVVEKETNVLWSREDLQQACDTNDYQEPDELTYPAEIISAVTSIYPGCPQLGGAAEDYSQYQIVGQTRHFLLFAKPAELLLPAIPT